MIKTSNKNTEFYNACKEAIIKRLKGEMPEFPDDIMIPDFLQDYVKLHRNKVQKEWGCYASLFWCYSELRKTKRDLLKRCGYDLQCIGKDFLNFLGKKEKKWLLLMSNPSGLLGQKFWSFWEDSKFSPLLLNDKQQRFRYKIKNRFNSIMSKETATFQCHDKIRGKMWELRKRSRDPSPADEREEVTRERLAREVGTITPNKYKGTDRDSPLLWKQDGIKIARIILEEYGTATSWDMVPYAIKCLPEDIVQRITYLENESDTKKEKILKDSSATINEMISIDPENAGYKQIEAIWQEVPMRRRILITTRLFLQPSWDFRTIEAWTKRFLPKEYQLTRSRANDRSGSKNARINTRLKSIENEIEGKVSLTTQEQQYVLSHLGGKMLGEKMPFLEEKWNLLTIAEQAKILCGRDDDQKCQRIIDSMFPQDIAVVLKKKNRHFTLIKYLTTLKILSMDFI